ncbi:MAG: RNA polymerase sigma factor [Mucilaginibacter polytrichastri]|nr:RNA polymerase sigma factor [Mucilaginibacter polytrichastri]
MEAVFVDKHFALVQACKQGNRKAQYELYRLYSKAMYNVAVRIVNDLDEAADVLQEAFLDAFSKIADFRQDTTFGLWMKQIVVNRSINRLRKKKYDIISIDDYPIADELADEDAEDDGEVQWKAAQVRDAIGHLPDQYRLVITLYLIEGYDHEEIGQIAGITENTSRTQFLRAKRKLIEILKEKGIAA